MMVFAAVTMVVMLGFLAMTLDVGAGGRQRRIAQTAADAGAIAGAAELWRGHVGLASSAAVTEVVRNGFDAGDATVSYPPATGPHAGNPAYVEVVINKPIPTIFGSLLGLSSLNVSARAVAGFGSYALNCIFSLDPDGARAIEVQNGGELDTNCGISINSTDPNALDVNSSGEIDTHGGGIAIAGDWTGHKDPLPLPATGAAPTINPLANLTMPTVGACTTTGKLVITKDTALTPGVFCGGLDVSSKRVDLAAGTYFFAGGGVHIASGGQLFGYGVTLVNTISGSYAFGPIDFGTGCKAQLSAPTSGDLKGIVMFQDPAAPADVVNTFACSSDTPPELTGTLYFPTQQILFNGSNTATQITGTVIAKKVVISGKIQVNNETSGNSANQRFTLVE